MIRVRKYQINIQSDKVASGGIHGWAGRLVSAGTLSTNSLALLLSASNTVTRADALGVIRSLIDEVRHWLREGYSVDLGDLGTMRATLTSTIANTIDEWTVPGNVRRINVRFNASSRLSHAVSKYGERVNFKVINPQS